MSLWRLFFFFFFFNDTATTEIYTLSLHDALPILTDDHVLDLLRIEPDLLHSLFDILDHVVVRGIVKDDSYRCRDRPHRDRKSTRLNSSHSQISYAVFCLKKKK